MFHFKTLITLLVCLLFTPLAQAELDIQFEVIAKSSDTPIPGGSGLFTGFGQAPAIDSEGNVVFSGAGNATGTQSFQSGVYTYIGASCQKVADRTTLVPNGGGATFDVFRGGDHHDIDGGRVAFVADADPSGSAVMGVYTNVGQSNAGSLAEVAVADGSEWSVVSNPWVDGNKVAVRGTRLIPNQHNAFLIWDGTEYFADPGSGYIVSPGTQASISNNAAIFRRYQSGSSQLGIYENGFYNPLVTLNSTPIPGQGGLTFSNVNNFPVVDRGGLDVAFRGNGSGGFFGVYKRVNGGALQQVVTINDLVPGAEPIPGWSDQIFKFVFEDGIALANGQVAFRGEGLNALAGLYTDVGGEVDVIVDNETNNTILLDGVPEQVTQAMMGPKSFAYTPQGYMLVFKATFSSGHTAIIRATINTGSTPPPPNQNPTAAFAFNCSDLSCSFANQSSDSDGSISSLSWNFGDGSSSSLANPEHTYTNAGDYNVTLTVTDNEGATDSVTKSVTVTVPNQAPVSRLSVSCNYLDCTFNGANSSDSDGTIVEYKFYFGDGNVSTTAASSKTHSFVNAGTYTASLIVKDDDGASHTSSETFTVSSAPLPNQPPQATFAFNCTDLNCSFTNQSSDSDGSISSLSWNFGDGTTSSAVNPSHSYSIAGTYTVTLTATDDDGATDSTSQSISVTAPPEPNQAPVADFNANCDELSCVFTSTSSDSDGQIVSASWSLGDGTNKSGNVISHTYAQAGTYEVTLTVQDDDGASNSKPYSVSVTAPPLEDSPPTVRITSPANGATVSGNVTIQVFAEDDKGLDSVKFYINGAFAYSAEAAPFSFTFDSNQYANGSLNLKVMAWDNASQYGIDRVDVNVDNTTAPEPPAPVDNEIPTVRITSPADGAVLSGGSQVTFAASASDNVGVSYVRFYVDGSLICTDSSENYTCSWQLPNAKGKSYQIRATATDLSGNSSSDTVSISSSGSNGGGSDKPCRGKGCK